MSSSTESTARPQGRHAAPIGVLPAAPAASCPEGPRTAPAHRGAPGYVASAARMLRFAPAGALVVAATAGVAVLPHLGSQPTAPAATAIGHTGSLGATRADAPETTYSVVASHPLQPSSATVTAPSTAPSAAPTPAAPTTAPAAPTAPDSQAPRTSRTTNTSETSNTTKTAQRATSPSATPSATPSAAPSPTSAGSATTTPSAPVTASATPTPTADPTSSPTDIIGGVLGAVGGLVGGVLGG